MAKTKFEQEIEEFTENFGRYREQNIVLYGTGRLTATIANNLEGFNIIGLCDRDEEQVGQIIYGLPIISRAQAELEGDILIINTAPVYWYTIYSRIENWNIPIYYKNGQLATKREENADKDNPYWNTTLDSLKNEIKQHNIISFDVFNTLVQRLYVSESDLFSIISLKLKQTGSVDFNFREIRKNATQSAGKYATIKDIYDKIQIATGISNEEKNNLLQLEIETDLEYVVGRDDIIKIAKQCMKEKKVLFVSDMYYDASIIQIFLRKIGVNAVVDNIYVSSEHKKCKRDGSLWEKVIEDYPNESVLHVGDDKVGDVDEPRKIGIDSFYVMNPIMMLEKSSIGKVVSQVINPVESLVLGLIANKIVNSPFKLGKTKGKVYFSSNEELGYCLFGPLMYTFHLWLMENAIKNKNDSLCFFAREGYLLTEQYDYLKEILKINSPNSIYLNISRRAIMNASIRTREELIEVASFPYDGTMAVFLKKRFNIQVDDENSEIQVSEMQKDENLLVQKLKIYEGEIFKEAERQRNNYLTYIRNIGADKNVGVVDSFLYGNTQYYLGKLLNRRLDGYYILLNKEDNICLQHQDMYSCFQDESDLSGKNNEIWSSALFLEAFLTAPHGMIMEVDDALNPVYDEKRMNQIKFQIREEMQRGILYFFDDITKYTANLDCKLDIKFVRRLFGSFMDNGFIKTNEFKESFYYDNAILNGKESPIFE